MAKVLVFCISGGLFKVSPENKIIFGFKSVYNSNISSKNVKNRYLLSKYTDREQNITHPISKALQ